MGGGDVKLLRDDRRLPSAGRACCSRSVPPRRSFGSAVGWQDHAPPSRRCAPRDPVRSPGVFLALGATGRPCSGRAHCALVAIPRSGCRQSKRSACPCRAVGLARCPPPAASSPRKSVQSSTSRIRALSTVRGPGPAQPAVVEVCDGRGLGRGYGPSRGDGASGSGASLEPVAGAWSNAWPGSSDHGGRPWPRSARKRLRRQSLAFVCARVPSTRRCARAAARRALAEGRSFAAPGDRAPTRSTSGPVGTGGARAAAERRRLRGGGPREGACACRASGVAENPPSPSPSAIDRAA
jgi:hypothetical protein